MLTIIRGRTFSFDATIFDTYVAEGDPGNVPTNHTGWTIRSQIRKKIGNVLVANLNVTFPVPTAGTVAIRHDRDFTRSLPVGDYWWDIVATDPSGIDHEYVEPEPIAVHDHPTDPSDSTFNYVPGGGGVINHTHVIADIAGLEDRLPPEGGTLARYLRGDLTWQLLNKSAVGLGSVENTALSTWTGTSNIATVGVLAGLRLACRTVAADDAILATDVTVLVDAAAGPVEVTLPPLASNQKRVFNIKKVDATANVVTITPFAGDTIENLANTDTDIPGESLQIQGFGTNWYIL